MKCCCFPITIEENKPINIKLETESKVNVGVSTAVIKGYGSDYEGAYVVIPKAFEETILPTNGKILADDITVKEIPYYETSNTKGKTVYIGGTLNG